MDEVAEIRKRYWRREANERSGLYSPLDPYVLMCEQEKDRAVVRWLRATGVDDAIQNRTLLEIGCGGGSNLQRFIRLGFQPQNVVGNDLLPERIRDARRVLPPATTLIEGDALSQAFDEPYFDVVCAFTVFSSILNDTFQERLADRAWRLIKPGGGLLWYDFVYNNPKNRDVRGVPMRRLHELFPQATVWRKRVTLAPPIGRRAARLHPSLYSFLNLVPILRSHVLCWLAKPKEAARIRAAA